jgi:hypothetical protein
MIAEWRRVEPSWRKDWRWVWAVDGAFPTVLFNRSVERPAPIGLAIKLRGFDSESAFDAQAVGLKGHIIWELEHDSIPWPKKAEAPTPSAHIIWQWAAGKRHRTILTRHLGKRDG